MRILVVAATDAETAPVLANLGGGTANSLRTRRCAHARHDVDVLTTGVGMVPTAAWCSRALGRTGYDLALNLGLCGSFDRTLTPGTVVHVVSDRCAETGAEDGDAFLTLEELRLVGDDEFPFTCGRLVNRKPPANVILEGLRAVDGITVNTVHGNERSIAAVTERFHPQVESMEGAGFMYACMIHGTLFAQVRAVSNVVERRNRSAWKVSDAIDRLGRIALEILNHA